jgi:hypothetical protein
MLTNLSNNLLTKRQENSQLKLATLLENVAIYSIISAFVLNSCDNLSIE